MQLWSSFRFILRLFVDAEFIFLLVELTQAYMGLWSSFVWTTKQFAIEVLCSSKSNFWQEVGRKGYAKLSLL